MKLHLPISLRFAIISLLSLVSLPAFSYEVKMGDNDTGNMYPVLPITVYLGATETPPSTVRVDGYTIINYCNMSCSLDYQICTRKYTPDSEDGRLYAYGSYTCDYLIIGGAKNVNFKNNYSSVGGTVATRQDFTMEFNGNSDISFEGNSASSTAGAIFNSGDILFKNNGDITFKNNTTTVNSSAGNSGGGVIYNKDVDSSISFYENHGNICFNGNGSMNHGGAIYNGGQLSFRNNQTIIFSNNNATWSGGAIHNTSFSSVNQKGVLEIENNKGDIIFENNSGDSGGAIHNTGQMVISNNQSVVFRKNSATYAGGGAIYGAMEIKGNQGDITFEGNTCYSKRLSSFGGAIYITGGNMLISANRDVNFFDNSAGTGGGAIANKGNMTVSNNRNVTYRGNSASALGGAIYNYRGSYSPGNLAIEDNAGKISFANNTATSGGAIYNDFYDDVYEKGSATLIIKDNSDDISFERNSASIGGAIYNKGALNISGNRDVLFSSNTASQYGGAIYNSGTLTLSDNGDVVFRGNKETETGRCRSLYSDGGEVTLSAKGGKSITFYDAIYTSDTTALHLNKGRSNGSVIFTSEYAETGTGESGILSEVYGTSTLHGGKLVVKEGVTLKGSSLDVSNEAGATIQLDNGRMTWTDTLSLGRGNKLQMQKGSIDNGTVALGNGSTLQVTNTNSISGNLFMGDGATFLFDVGASSASSGIAPLLTVGGTLTQEDSLNIQITSSSDIQMGRKYALLSAENYDKACWNTQQVQVSGSSCKFNDLVWVGNTLYIDKRADLFFYGTEGGTVIEWKGVNTWSPDNTYTSYTSFADASNVHFERKGLLALREEVTVKTASVHLENNDDAVRINLSNIGETSTPGVINVESTLYMEKGQLDILASTTGNASGLKFAQSAPTDGHINFSACNPNDSATLCISGSQDFSGVTIKWNTPNAGTLELANASQSSPSSFSFNVLTSRLVIGDKQTDSMVADKLISLDLGSDVVFSSSTRSSSLYKAEEKRFDFFPYWSWLNNNGLLSSYGNTKASAFIYQGDVYYGNKETHELPTLSQRGTWWAPQSGTRNVYDTEKFTKSSSGMTPDYKNKALYDRDAISCSLCTGINIVGHFLDKYAPLMCTGEKPVILTGGSSSADSTSLAYKSYLECWKSKKEGDSGNRNQYEPNVLAWLLIGEAHFWVDNSNGIHEKHPFAVFPSSWWTPEELYTVTDDFAPETGKIYHITGQLSQNRFDTLMRAAFDSPCTAGPVALSFNTGQKDADGKDGYHVVTCWGYETAWINEAGEEREIITKIWRTDSDDHTAYMGDNKLAYDVTYANGRVYLIDPAYNAGSLQVTGITFMTTPDGMDDMLEQYNSSSTPIYWTGKSGDRLWKTDNSITYDANGIIESQTRLAEYTDGWSKYCRTEATNLIGLPQKSVWAHSVFTGQESKVVFADSINGNKLENERKQVYTFEINAPDTTAEIQGKGFSFLTCGEHEKADISLKKLVLEPNADLEIGAGIILEAPVELKEKSTLVNYGTMKSIVTMESGSSFISGIVQVTQSESEYLDSLGNGFYALSKNSWLNGWVELTTSGSYTLGTTFDLAELSTAGKLAFKAYTPDVREAYIINLFGLAETNGVDFRFDIRYMHDSLKESAMSILNGVQNFLFASDIEISGSSDAFITVGSGKNEGDSAAHIVVSETHGGQVTAPETALATVAGENALFGNETSIHAKSFTVTSGSHLTNNGSLTAIDSIAVEGMMDGSGQFGNTVVLNGGELTVETYSLAPTYENLTVEDGGLLDFHVDPDAVEYMLQVTNTLVLGADANIAITVSPDYLTSKALGKNTTLNIAKLGTAADADLLQVLQNRSTFQFISEDERLSPDDLNVQVRRYSWTANGNSLDLNMTLGYVHNEVLTWVDGEMNGLWDTASYNWCGEDGNDTEFDYGYTCRFTDEGAGDVTIVGELDPDAVEVDSAANYNFTGSGSIINGTITKKGTGSLTIATANSYTGGTVIEEGAVVVGNEKALGTGEVLLKGGELDLAGIAIDNGIVAEGGTLANAGNYDGDLTVGGEVRVEGAVHTNSTTLAEDEGKMLLGTSYIESAAGKEGHIGGATIEHTGGAQDTVAIRGGQDAPATVSDVHIDMAKGSLLILSNVLINSGVRITDDPATVVFDNTHLNIVNGENATTTAGTVEGINLLSSQSGKMLELTGWLNQLSIQTDAVNSVTMDGTSLTIYFSGFELTDVDLVKLTFGEDGFAATFAENTGLSITGVLDGRYYVGFFETGTATLDRSSVYFATKSKEGLIPEPTTTTLSLLALASLAYRRRRKAA